LTTAQYFSSCPSDPTLRWTPCPPVHGKVASGLPWRCPAFAFVPHIDFSIPSFPRPARNYPRFRIRRPSSERRRDLNPPDHHAAQRTIWDAPTSCRPSRRASLPSLGSTIFCACVCLSRLARRRPRGLELWDWQPQRQLERWRRQDLPGSWKTLLCLRPVLRPRQDRRIRPIRCADVAPAPSTAKTRCKNTNFGAQSHGLGTRCLRFAQPVARAGRKTRFWLLASSTRRDWLPAGFQRKVFKLLPTSRPPFPSFPGANWVRVAAVPRRAISVRTDGRACGAIRPKRRRSSPDDRRRAGRRGMSVAIWPGT
jgi:hypothetical protein